VVRLLDVGSKFGPTQVGGALARLWTVDASGDRWRLQEARDVMGRLTECPITLTPPVDPVLLSDGFVYEKEAILKWLQHHDQAPCTNERLTHKTVMRLTPLKAAVEKFLAECPIPSSATARLDQTIETTPVDGSMSIKARQQALESLETRIEQGIAEMAKWEKSMEKGRSMVTRLRFEQSQIEVLRGAARRFMALKIVMVERAKRARLRRAVCVLIRKWRRKMEAKCARAMRIQVAWREHQRHRQRQAALPGQLIWREDMWYLLYLPANSAENFLIALESLQWYWKTRSYGGPKRERLLPWLLVDRTEKAQQEVRDVWFQIHMDQVAEESGPQAATQVKSRGKETVAEETLAWAFVRHAANRMAEVGKGSTVGSALLFVAIQGYHTAATELLIECKASVGEVMANITVLHEACDGGQATAARQLVKNRADVNKSTEYGITPLIIASLRGHERITHMLLNKRASVEKFASDGSTALHCACENGCEGVVRALLAYRAAPNLQTPDGTTPLFSASAQGHLAAVKQLLVHRATVDIRRKDGSTALHVASAAGQKDIVTLLLANGASVRAFTHTGATPSDLASDVGHWAVVQLLRDRESIAKDASLNLDEPTDREAHVFPRGGHEGRTGVGEGSTDSEVAEGSEPSTSSSAQLQVVGTFAQVVGTFAEALEVVWPDLMLSSDAVYSIEVAVVEKEATTGKRTWNIGGLAKPRALLHGLPEDAAVQLRVGAHHRAGGSLLGSWLKTRTAKLPAQGDLRDGPGARPHGCEESGCRGFVHTKRKDDSTEEPRCARCGLRLSAHRSPDLSGLSSSTQGTNQKRALTIPVAVGRIKKAWRGRLRHLAVQRRVRRILKQTPSDQSLLLVLKLISHLWLVRCYGTKDRRHLLPWLFARNFAGAEKHVERMGLALSQDQKPHATRAQWDDKTSETQRPKRDAKSLAALAFGCETILALYPAQREEEAPIHARYLQEALVNLQTSASKECHTIGDALLFLAVGNGHKEAAHLLLDCGASPNACNADGYTIFRCALDGGLTNIAKRLHGAITKDVRSNAKPVASSNPLEEPSRRPGRPVLDAPTFSLITSEENEEVVTSSAWDIEAEYFQDWTPGKSGMDDSNKASKGFEAQWHRMDDSDDEVGEVHDVQDEGLGVYETNEVHDLQDEGLGVYESNEVHDLQADGLGMYESGEVGPAYVSRLAPADSERVRGCATECEARWNVGVDDGGDTVWEEALLNVTVQRSFGHAIHLAWPGLRDRGVTYSVEAVVLLRNSKADKHGRNPVGRRNWSWEGFTEPRARVHGLPHNSNFNLRVLVHKNGRRSVVGKWVQAETATIDYSLPFLSTDPKGIRRGAGTSGACSCIGYINSESQDPFCDIETMHLCACCGEHYITHRTCEEESQQ